jgi:drug/metabolite transporter (DMT)-like permease
VLAALLALGTSLSWGVSDFLGGLAARRRHAAAVLLVGQLCGLVAIALAVVVLSPSWPGLASMWPAAAAGVGWALGILALYRALAIGPIGVVAPLLTLSQPIPVIAGIATGDRPSALQVAGMVLAFVGLVAAVRPTPEVEADASRETAGAAGERDRRRSRLPLGIVLALVAALLLGSELIGIDASAQESPLWTLAVARVAGVVVIGLLAMTVLPRARADTAALVRRPGNVPFVGLLDVAGVAFFALATNDGTLSVVSMLATLFPAVTVVLARVVLHERLSARRLAGSGVLLVGALLLAAG